jgi:hypothetical protein
VPDHRLAGTCLEHLLAVRISGASTVPWRTDCPIKNSGPRQRSIVSSRATRTILISGCVAVVGLVLAGGGFSHDGDSPRVIIGWIMFMGGLVVGVTAGLLGDRSNLGDRRGVTGTRRRALGRLQRPGLVAIVLSGVLALLALIGLANRLSPQACDHAGFAATDAKLVSNAVWVDEGGLRSFPPGRICQRYGQLDAPGHLRVYLGQKVVPGAESYVLGLVMVAFPIALSTAWRTVRQRFPEPQPPARVTRA